MNDILKVFLSLSLSGSLLILVLFLFRKFLKDKISRQWQYYIWLIVIARLLLPFAPETNLMGSIFQIIDRTIIVQPEIDFQNIENVSVFDIEQQDIKQTKQRSSSWPIQDLISLLINNIWLVWIVIALVLFIRKITTYQNFVNYVKAGQIPIADTQLLDRLAMIGEQAGVEQAVELCVNPLISSPLLIGFFCPYIVVPSANVSEKDFKYIVLHELTHYRRRDMFYKWLVQVTVCLHWFNPLVYLMSREINKACEFSCDEAVIAKLNLSDIQDYAKTLLENMGKYGYYKEAIASVTLNENKEMLKERLGAIMNFKKNSRLVMLFSIIFTLLFSIGATITGVYAFPSNELLTKDIKQAKSSDIITPKQADTMALALTNKIWVWDWIAFFVPYMSDEGCNKIILTAESSEWAGSIDMTTGKPLQITKKEVDYARSQIPKKKFLTKKDIDAHALMIIQLNGRWDCIDFMLPYMTDNGISNVKNVYSQKNKNVESTLDTYTSSADAKKNTQQVKSSKIISSKDADKEAIRIMKYSGTWGESIERLLPFMSSKAIEKVLKIYINRHIFSGISTPEDIKEVEQKIQVAYPYMTKKSINRVKQYIKLKYLQ